MPSPADPRVLAVRFSSIGDILLTTPLYRALKARHPGAHLTVLTKPAFASLVEGNPRVDRVLTLGRGEPLTALAARLRAERFTHCLDLHGSLRTAALRRLVPGRWRGYRKRAAARWALIHLKRDWYRDAVPVAERYFEAARDLDLHPDGGPPEFVIPAGADAAMSAWLGETGIPRRYVTLAPGAAHATKRWPLERWVELARGLAAAGLGVVAVGGADDADAARAVAAAAGPAGASAAGRTALPETAALLRRSAATAAGDTGVMHLATAVGTPVVALFGPTVRQFGFFPYTDRATVVERALDCRPCSAHGSERCPLGHHDCLRTIAVAEVRAALDGWLR